ncbi:ABC-2 type transport system permease protein [Micromonospora phaseoli]|uniref:ABC-2 type transport system permease protein n=1 Tax=Micromonospora phaseoli TaxID=1144548 RepID=A0A1H7AD31_9ACTN|nr:polyketide antibiotic transporter [Micromonospora phaseoli]PZV96449.1 ABC-2 type transport system permease protein [Micromonospora phaseoli]GIJ76137.1 exporter of polyketide antibiotics [Micromonospora phaseoli]SEJ63501.1 ABC-2 type transport system permease protein [Micromonospora phaseoli]
MTISGSPRSGTATAAVTRLALRQVSRGALAVTAVAAGTTAIVVAGYQGTVGGALDAAALAALAENPAIRTLFGEPVALDTAGGFTVWRTGTVLAVLLSVWGLLTTTRVTRGEEESGRWDLLLAGRLTVPAVLGRHLVVLAAAVVLAGTTVGVVLTAAGTPSAGALRYAAGLTLVGLFAVSLALLAAQVMPTRAGASGATLAVLGVGLLARMVGDGIAALGWLRWLSPYGLLALTGAYHDDRLLPLLVLSAAALVPAVAAMALAGRRDLRAGLVTAPAGRPPRRWLLGTVEGFAARRLLRPLAGWSVGIGTYFLLIGLLTVSMTRFLSDNPRFAELAGQAGFAELGSVRGYTATMFALLAAPIGLFAAIRLAEFVAAETDGRLTSLYAQPVSRTRLLAAETLATLAGVAVLLTVAAVTTWLGAYPMDARLPLTAALAGTWNVLPIVLLCLGAGLLAVGWLPRATAAIGALPAVGGFLLQVIADSADLPDQVVAISPFAHLAAVPAESPNWPAALVMTAIAMVAAALGLLNHRRRDLLG